MNWTSIKTLIGKWLSDPNTQTAIMASFGLIAGYVAQIESHQITIATGAGGIVFTIAKAVWPANVALQKDLQATATDLVNQVNTKTTTTAAIVMPVTKG
jgi:hypothetical protein